MGIAIQTLAGDSLRTYSSRCQRKSPDRGPVSQLQRPHPRQVGQRDEIRIFITATQNNRLTQMRVAKAVNFVATSAQLVAPTDRLKFAAVVE